MSDPVTEPVAVSRLATWRRWIIVALLLGVVLWLAGPTVLSAWGDFLACGRPLDRPVDLVFVLGGDLETRPFVAAEIYRAGYTPRILISQPQGHAFDFLGGRTEGELTREVLEHLGVPPRAISTLPREVDSTRAEMEALRDLLREQPVVRLAIVTSDFHTRRTALLAQRICGSDVPEIHIVAAPYDSCRPDDWYTDANGMAVYLLETLKLLTVWCGVA
jgi:uncharacterized SAM-binding protein YcdF (DUF218 family)